MVMRVAPVPHFWAGVGFSMIGDMDQSIEVSFKVKYRRLEQEEYEALLARVHASRRSAMAAQVKDLVTVAGEGQAEDAAADSAKPITDMEVIEYVVLDWDDVVGDNDEKLPFTRDNLALTLRALGCKAAIVKRFFDLHGKELEKNFAPRPATTSVA